MKLPNKNFSYEESVLSKFSPILSILLIKDEKPLILYKKINKFFKNIDEYLYTIDCLFAMNKVILLENGDLHYVR